MSARNRSWAAVNLFVLLFGISAILGVLPAYDPNLSARLLAAILGGVAIYFVLSELARSRAALQLVCVLILLVMSAFGLYIIVQFGYMDYTKGGLIVRLGQATTLLPDLHGFRPQPNAAAAFIEAAVPLGIALTVSSRGTTARVLLGAGTVVVLYALFLTASRGAWVALAAAGGIFVALAVLKRLPGRIALVIVAGGAAGVVVAFLGIAVLGPDRLPFLASTFSRASDRSALFHNSLYLAGDYAFTGIGLGDTFGMVYSRYGLLLYVPFLFYAHNLPLSVWLNQGIVGLTAFCGIVGALYLQVARVLRNGHGEPLFHGAWLGVTVMLLHGLTDAPEYSPSSIYVMPMLFVAAGLAAGWGRLAMAETAGKGPSGVHSVPRGLGIGLSLSLAVAALVVTFNPPLRATWHTNMGAIAETRGELGPGLSEGERARLYASAQDEYLEALAIDAEQSHANRRLGNLLVKLDRFDAAVPRLEAAYRLEPDNPAAVKGLGLAYVWVGKTREAARLFLRLADPPATAMELQWWGFYRSQQERPLLSAYAYETASAMIPTR